MGPKALLPLRRKWCSGFLSPLKIHRPRSGSNPRTLGPVANLRPLLLWNINAALVNSWLPTFQENISVPFSRIKQSKKNYYWIAWPTKLGPTCFPETSVIKHQPTSRTIPQKAKSSTKPRRKYEIFLKYATYCRTVKYSAKSSVLQFLQLLL
jgi:hypothetical protein